MSHIINCKKKLSREFFYFLIYSCSVNLLSVYQKNIGGVPSYFSFYKATSDRARSLLFRKYNWQCPVATIG